MALISKTLQRMRWYQWLLAALAGVYILYLALSYLYVPGKLQALLQQDVAQVIGREIQVGHIAFDPFRLALEVDQFAIADRPGKPLLSWQRFYINLQVLKSLFSGQVRLARVDLDQLQINIERRRDDFNFSSILSRFPTESAPEQPEQKTAFAVQVDNINIRDGGFALDDISGNKVAHSALDQITLGVKNLYLATGDDKLNPFQLDAEMPGGGKLTLSGEYRADPLRVNSTVVIEKVALAKFADFVENLVPAQVTDGTLSVRAQVNLEQKNALDLQVKQGQLQVQNLAVDDAQTDPPLMRLRQLEVSGIDVDLLQQSVTIDSLAIDGLSTHQWLNPDGSTRYEPLLVKKTVEANQAAVAHPDANPDWSVTLKQVSLRQGETEFIDRRDGLNAAQTLKDISLDLHNLSLVQGNRMPVQLSADINNGGKLQVQGDLVLVPFAMTAHYQLQNLPLLPFNPYITAHSWLHLQQGALSVAGDVQFEASDPMPLQLKLDLTVADLRAEDTRTGRSVMQMQALQLEQVAFDLQQQAVQIERVAVLNPDIAAELGNDKQMNLATLAKPAPEQGEAAPSPAEPTSAPAQPYNVAINTIAVENGTLRFHDASVQPAFKTSLNNLAVKIDHLSSHGPQPAALNLSARVDKYAPFNVKGTLAPLQQQPGFAFKSQLQGLEMPGFSPYTGTFIGYQLQSGKLSLDLDYELKQRQLKGNNAIIAKQLYLGDKVVSEQAVDAPVALGLALLRDVNGVIDLDVGVAGDLDDPGFSVGGIVLKALSNVIVKAATSPFKMLGSLVGGSEDLGRVEFAQGSAELRPQDQTNLSKLAEALAQRPQLMVDVKGSASLADDGLALQVLKVRDQIALARKQAPVDLPVETLLADDANRDELDALNKALKLPNADDRAAAMLLAQPERKGQDLTTSIYQQMLEDVAKQQTVSQQELQALADQRALAIKQFLVETAHLEHGRIQMEKTRKADLKGRVCELGLAPG